MSKPLWTIRALLTAGTVAVASLASAQTLRFGLAEDPRNSRTWSEPRKAIRITQPARERRTVGIPGSCPILEPPSQRFRRCQSGFPRPQCLLFTHTLPRRPFTAHQLTGMQERNPIKRIGE